MCRRCSGVLGVRQWRGVHPLSPAITTASEREQACSRFDRARLGYITVFDDGTERVCFLHDAEGIEIVASRVGQVPLNVYAAEHGIELLTRH